MCVFFERSFEQNIYKERWEKEENRKRRSMAITIMSTQIKPTQLAFRATKPEDEMLSFEYQSKNQQSESQWIYLLCVLILNENRTEISLCSFFRVCVLLTFSLAIDKFSPDAKCDLWVNSKGYVYTECSFFIPSHSTWYFKCKLKHYLALRFIFALCHGWFFGSGKRRNNNNHHRKVLWKGQVENMKCILDMAKKKCSVFEVTARCSNQTNGWARARAGQSERERKKSRKRKKKRVAKGCSFH